MPGHPPRKRRLLLITLPTVMAAVLLGGCAGNDDTAGEPAATGSSETSTAAETEQPSSGVPASPDGADRAEGQGSGDPVVLTDVRVRQHDGFDRVVLEFSGTGTPGWVAHYVDEAVVEGSGEVVDLDGNAVLDVQASNTTWPAPDYYSGPQRLGGGDVPDVHVAGTFEGHTQVFAGLDDADAPFRVFTLTRPSRLVVDVVDE